MFSVRFASFPPCLQSACGTQSRRCRQISASVRSAMTIGRIFPAAWMCGFHGSTWKLGEISRNRVSSGLFQGFNVIITFWESCDMKSKFRIYDCNLNPSKTDCTSLRVAICPFLVVSPWLMFVLQKSPKYVVENPLCSFVIVRCSRNV